MKRMQNNRVEKLTYKIKKGKQKLEDFDVVVKNFCAKERACSFKEVACVMWCYNRRH
jgi:hypothetical protein